MYSYTLSYFRVLKTEVTPLKRGNQPGMREDILGGTWKHLMGYVNLEKKKLFRDKH
jgi:hypothetical protein